MRRRWENEENLDDNDNLDEPITITGRQLRSLKRGARVGLFGVLLAFVAIGLATWNLLSSTRGAANNDTNLSPASSAPEASGSMAMETATPGAPTATGTPAVAPQAVQPSVPAPAATTTAAPAEMKPATASNTSTKAAAVRRGRVATARVAARNASATPSASGRQPERGVPIEMPSPALSTPAVTPAPAPATKSAAPADTAKSD